VSYQLIIEEAVAAESALSGVRAVSIDLSLDDAKRMPILAEIFQRVLEQVKDSLPPKQELLDFAGRLYDATFLVVDLPGPDAIIHRFLKPAFLRIVEQAYDRLMGS
jgi:hypothetical protein